MIRWLLRFRLCVIVSLAVILILAAIAFSLVRAVLPHATGYKAKIEAELSQQIGLPVHVEGIDADMHWFSPRLKLLQVSVYNATNKVPLFHFKKILFELDTFRSLLRGELTVGEISLVGVTLSVEKQTRNRWLIQGVEIKNNQSTGMAEKLLYTLQHANYSLLDSNIYYRDLTKNKLSLNLLDVNVNVKNYLDNHTLDLNMKLPAGYGQDLHVVAELKGVLDKSISGKLYINGSGINLKQWKRYFDWLPDFRLSGVVSSSVWLTVKNNLLTKVVAQLTAMDFSIANSKEKISSWKVDKLSTLLRLKKLNKQWRLNISSLEMEQKGKPLWPEPVNIIAGIDGNNLFFNADFLRLQDILKIANIIAADSKPLKVIAGLKPVGDIYNLQLMYSGSNAGNTRLQGDFANFGFNLQHVPVVVAGLGARIKFNKNKINIQFLSQNVTITLANLFRQPLLAKVLTGKGVVQFSKQFKKNHAWSFSTPLLHIKNAHIDTYSRLSLTMPPVITVVKSTSYASKKKVNPKVGKLLAQAQQHLFIDMQTSFYDAYTKYTSVYLPVGIMQPALVNWLDNSIRGGYTEAGSFILHGNADDFPYADGSGVMEILFHPVNINLKFLHNWPAISNLSANIKFYNQSMSIYDGIGNTSNGYISNVSANIPDLEKPQLKVKAKIVSSIKNLQHYITHSPLEASLGKTFRIFKFKGETLLDLSLNIPLYADVVTPSYKGDLRLNHVSWYYPELAYSLKNVNGNFHFTKNSITATRVRALIDGRPVLLSAHTIKKNTNPEVIFKIHGPINIDTLLKTYKWVPKNWLTGVSPWDISVFVPFHPKKYLVHVNAESTLKGVSIKVSDAVSKLEKQVIPVSIALDVMAKDKLRIKLKSKKIISLSVLKDSAGLITFSVSSPMVIGKGDFVEGLDKQTKVNLNLDKLDLYALLKSKANKQVSGRIRPTDFPPLNWQIKTLLWNGWTFNNIFLKTSRQQHGMVINKLKLTGPAMTLDAKGSWLSNWRYKNKTVFSGNIHSDNMGTTLAGLGFEKSIEKSKLDARFNASWQAEPYSLLWKNVTGKTTFNLKNGTIPNVNPGAGGRLLGLMNVFQLTNRLALNFKDVYKKGFSFDKIAGELDFVNGEGTLKNFDIKAPSADINMFGDIGLVKHNYNLLMRVKPHSNGIAFAGGALLGGVAVGAGLALIQKIFNINLIGDDVYTITGTWDKPEIKKITQKSDTNNENTDDYSF